MQYFNRLSPVTKIALGLLAAGLGAVIMWFGFNFVVDKVTGRTAMRQEIDAFPAIPGCREFSRYYMSPGIDTVSSWMLGYECNVGGETQDGVATIGEVHDSIVKMLKQRGYKAVDDKLPKQEPGEAPSRLYYFAYDNGKYEVSYTLDTDENIESDDQLLGSEANRLSLTIK